MKKQLFWIGFIGVFLVEIVVLIVFAIKIPDFSQDSVAVNEVIQSVTQDLDHIEEHRNVTTLEYVVLDNKDVLLYKTKSGLSESANQAISHRDTILDITMDNSVVAKVIIYNDSVETFQNQKRTIIIILAISIVILWSICMGYVMYAHLTIIHPFHKLKGFAERIAVGNLDIPLEMDRQNLFGAFTESFDIMRSELKKAKIAEAQAQQSKKELVAKLSHDIKTPIASIKALSEVGLAITSSDKDRRNYTQIIGKADQINTLVNNLFTATLEELEQLTVSPTHVESMKLKTMLENADYLHQAVISDIPECLIYIDTLRLQQVFDNIFANAYKYAKTKLFVSVQKNDKYMVIAIEDFGGGVLPEELNTLKEKFKRGHNAKHIEGAGLGLYISDYFMKEMKGKLLIENGAKGLIVTVMIVLSGEI